MTDIKSVEKKNKALGMNYSTAHNRLTKDLLYHLAERLSMLNCHRCGHHVCRDDFSIEHVDDWLDSETPAETFFDVENIQFSHLSCNVKASIQKNRPLKHGGWMYQKHGCRCSICTEGYRQRLSENAKYRRVARRAQTSFESSAGG